MLMIFTGDRRIEECFRVAVSQLRENIHPVYGNARPVLLEGGDYQGIWLECGPHEGLVYAVIDPRIGLNNHRVFFDQQRPDGGLPCWIRTGGIGFGQIQMVVPITRTALELARLTGDEEFLSRAYEACVRWDRWLATHRDTRKTGLCEAFCEFDTGHDNSPRWKGLPKACVQEDAARYDDHFPVLPYLSPDLSATVYGGRLALAKMARLLGKDDQAAEWEERADRIRRVILTQCFDEKDLFFYDRDAQNNLVRVRGDILTRVLQEHVPDPKLAETLFDKHILNPSGFWAPFPLPSIAMNDSAYDPQSEHNSWGGPSQALTALRAPRWFEHYGRYAELRHLMHQWLQAIMACGRFGQQIDPTTGKMGTPVNYSPAMLVFIDFLLRSYGVLEETDRLVWTAGILPRMDQFRVTLQSPRLHLEWSSSPARAAATLSGKEIFQIKGNARIETDLQGNLLRIIGIESEKTTIHLSTNGKEWPLTLLPNQIIPMAELEKRR